MLPFDDSGLNLLDRFTDHFSDMGGYGVFGRDVGGVEVVGRVPGAIYPDDLIDGRSVLEHIFPEIINSGISGGVPQEIGVHAPAGDATPPLSAAGDSPSGDSQAPAPEAFAAAPLAADAGFAPVAASAAPWHAEPSDFELLLESLIGSHSAL